ncbi:MAG: hypothetical protein ACRCST_08615 [Turicibacter sp.]
MKYLAAIILTCVPLCVVQYIYLRWFDGTSEPKHHKNSDYIDEGFKMNFIEKKVDSLNGKDEK